MSDNVIIVGAGQAGAQTAISLRTGGFKGPITLIGDEPYLPYERPPLSKNYLAGEMDGARLLIKSPQYYADSGIDLRMQRRVERIDRIGCIVEISDGSCLPYDWLVLATGGRVRPLDVPGADLRGVHYLRSIQDVDAFREKLIAGTRLIIIGGGYIGLEVAAIAHKHGCKITLLETMPRVLNRVTAQALSQFYTDTHREAGVHVRVNASVSSLEGNGEVRTVHCDNEALPADLVIIGVGLVPNVELAAETGLPVDNGIVVDECTRTLDPRILAVGDCTSQPSALYGGRYRLESVSNAIGQGKAAASVIIGSPVPFSETPSFWSDQYDLKLQMVGVPQSEDQVVIRGDMSARKFSACFLRDGVLVAVQSINMMKDFVHAKTLIANRWRPDSVKLADANISLKELAG